MARCLKQLYQSTMDKVFLSLPKDVSLIGEEDSKGLGHVNLLIAGWLCQGCSRAGARQSLDDP